MPAYLAAARERLQTTGANVTVVCDNYENLGAVLAEARVTEVDAVLLDGECQSMQLDNAARGFSMQKDGPLRHAHGPAAETLCGEEYIAQASVGELERVFVDPVKSRRRARSRRRSSGPARRCPIVRTRELAELVRAVVGGGGRVHPATRVFQALRIAVNDGFGSLERGVRRSTRWRKGGRLVVITLPFARREDRQNRVPRSGSPAGRVKLVTDPLVLPKDSEVM